MNKLPLEKRVQILTMLCEGSSMRAISRVVGVSINTVDKLLRDAGEMSAAFHDANVRKVAAKKVQCDEIWSFCYAKAKNTPTAKSAPDGAGDVWTFTALDADSKLIISWLVGSRDGDTAYYFMRDLKDRLANKVQLTTDAFRGYSYAVGAAFGVDPVDYAMLVKLYGQSSEGPRGSAERRYSPAACIGANKSKVFGDPDQKYISTSFVERQNLTMRMSMRRFTRLTNAFSKKFANHCHALALYFFWYNWIRQHKAHKLTPAMAAGLTEKIMDMSDLVALIDAREEEKRGEKIYARFEVQERARQKLANIS